MDAALESPDPELEARFERIRRLAAANRAEYARKKHQTKPKPMPAPEPKPYTMRPEPRAVRNPFADL